MTRYAEILRLQSIIQRQHRRFPCPLSHSMMVQKKQRRPPRTFCLQSHFNFHVVPTNVYLTRVEHFLYSPCAHTSVSLRNFLHKIMNGKLVYTLITVLCASIFSSCVPYDENGRPIPNRRPQNKNQPTVSDKKQQELDAKREELRKKEEARKKAENRMDDTDDAEETIVNNNPKPKPKPKLDESDTELPKPPTPPTPPKNHPVAAAVPGNLDSFSAPSTTKSSTCAILPVAPWLRTPSIHPLRRNTSAFPNRWLLLTRSRLQIIQLLIKI